MSSSERSKGVGNRNDIELIYSLKCVFCLTALFLLVLVAFSLSSVYAADPEIEWTKTYGGDNFDYGGDVVAASDGFVIVGDTSVDNDQSYLYMIKTDPNGNMIWDKSYPTSGMEHGSSVAAINGGYVIVGQTASGTNGYYDVCLVKTDLDGNLLWTKNYGGYALDSGSDILVVSDGYIIVGSTYSFGNGDYDIYLIKTDFEGNQIWSKTYGGAKVDKGSSIALTQDGYIISGSTNSLGNGNSDACLLKTDFEGNQVWLKTYGGSGWEYGNDIIVKSDGYLVKGLRGTTELFKDIGNEHFDFYLVKTDLEGNEVWSKTCGWEKCVYGGSVAAVDDGYYIAGYARMGFADYDIYIVKTDLNGNKVWGDSWGNGHYDEATSVISVSDGVVITGFTNFADARNIEVFLTKIVDKEDPYDSFPRPASIVKAPPMTSAHPQAGAISGRVTTSDTSVGIPNAYVAIVNACNTNQAFYLAQTDSAGFYQVPIVNNTYDGSGYQLRYKAYADHNSFGYGYSSSFPVEERSTAPANVIITGGLSPTPPAIPTPTPTILHYPNNDFVVVPAPAMGTQHAGAVSGRFTTCNLSYGIPNADILIVDSDNTSKAYYVGKSNSQGYYEFTGVNCTYVSATDTFDSRYKIFAYHSAYGEAFSNRFSVEPYTTAPANTVVIPMPSQIHFLKVKNSLVANGSDNFTITAYITDARGDPVVDGTSIEFIINNGSTYDVSRMGHWGQASGQHITVHTNYGYAEATYGWIPEGSTEQSIDLSILSPYDSVYPANRSIHVTINRDLAIIEWSKTYGGLRKTGRSIVPLFDGYAITGSVSSPDTSEDVYLARTDLSGNLLWEKTYGTAGMEQGNSMVAVRDGFVIAGIADGGSGLSDLYVVKTDSCGNVIWQKTYGGANSENGMSIIAVNDGYLVTGLTFSSGHGSADVYLLKLDKAGNVLWERTYGGSDWDCGYSVAATNDGYIITGSTSSSGNGDVYLIKTDKMGNVVWEKAYGGDDVDSGNSVVVASDGYVIAGYTVSYADHSYASGSCDLYLLKADLDGNLVWQKVYGGIRGDIGNSIAAAKDGYIIAGSSDPDSVYPDAYFVKTDLSGDLIWQKMCNETLLDNLYSVAVVEDGYVAVGYTVPSISDKSEIYLVKVSELSTPDASEVVSYDLALTAGWNLISVPVVMQDTSISALFPADVLNNIASIWGWDEAEQNWVYYSSSDDYFYEYYPALTELEPGKAYWVEMSQPAIVTIQGTVPDYAPDSETVIGSGWNFVGPTGMSSPLIASMYPDALSVWGWDEAEQNWVYYSPDDYYFYDYYPELNNARPGHGYWVEMA